MANRLPVDGCLHAGWHDHYPVHSRAGTSVGPGSNGLWQFTFLGRLDAGSSARSVPRIFQAKRLGSGLAGTAADCRLSIERYHHGCDGQSVLPGSWVHQDPDREHCQSVRVRHDYSWLVGWRHVGGSLWLACDVAGWCSVGCADQSCVCQFVMVGRGVGATAGVGDQRRQLQRWLGQCGVHRLSVQSHPSHLHRNAIRPLQFVDDQSGRFVRWVLRARRGRIWIHHVLHLRGTAGCASNVARGLARTPSRRSHGTQR